MMRLKSANSRQSSLFIGRNWDENCGIQRFLGVGTVLAL
jgi:hypothetical protein